MQPARSRIGFVMSRLVVGALALTCATQGCAAAPAPSSGSHPPQGATSGAVPDVNPSAPGDPRPPAPSTVTPPLPSRTTHGVRLLTAPLSVTPEVGTISTVTFDFSTSVLPPGVDVSQDLVIMTPDAEHTTWIPAGGDIDVANRRISVQAMRPGQWALGVLDPALVESADELIAAASDSLLHKLTQLAQGEPTLLSCPQGGPSLTADISGASSDSACESYLGRGSYFLQFANRTALPAKFTVPAGMTSRSMGNRLAEDVRAAVEAARGEDPNEVVVAPGGLLEVRFDEAALARLVPIQGRTDWVTVGLALSVDLAGAMSGSSVRGRAAVEAINHIQDLRECRHSVGAQAPGLGGVLQFVRACKGVLGSVAVKMASSNLRGATTPASARGLTRFVGRYFDLLSRSEALASLARTLVGGTQELVAGTGRKVTIQPASVTQAQGQSGVYFRSPSGNIFCGVFDNQAACEIEQHEWPDSAPAEGGHDPYGPASFVVDDQGARAAVGNFGDLSAERIVEAPYGSVVTVARSECEIAKTGVTCRNLTNGHGFTVARASYKLF